jgi:ABC-type sugar transport system permease subunit
MPSFRTLLAATGRPNRVARRVSLALAVLFVVANAGFALWSNQLSTDPLLSSADGSSASLVLANAAGEGEVLVADRDDAVTLFRDGAPAAKAQFDQLVGAIAAAPSGKEFYAGTSDGTVTVLDASLTPTRTFSVQGRVVGLAATPAGLFVAHGVGAFGDQYFVSHVPPGANEPATSFQVGFTINALTTFGDGVLYGTDDSRVGLILPGADTTAWETTLRNPVSRLLGNTDAGRILAGSDDGDLTEMDGTGQIRWTSNVSSYPLRGLAINPDTSNVFAGDSRGNLAIVDNTGVVSLTELVTDADLEAILPTGGESYLIVPRDGAWQALNPGALDATRLQAIVRVAWWTTSAILILALIAAAVVAVEPARAATGGKLRAASRARMGYVFLLPAMALILFFSYYPAGLAFYYSFTSFSLRSVTEFIGIENYREVLLEDRYFWTGMTNMGIIVGTSILKTITIPLLVAELVFWLRNSFHQYFFRTLFVLPAVVPDLVFTLMWRQVYDPNTGLLNQLLASMGLNQFRRAWLGNEDTAIWAIVGVGFPFVSAFAFLIFIGGMLSINGDYFDAAKVDGATWWQRFIHMDVPLLLPQFRVLLFFATVGAVQGFAGVFILTRGGPGTATYVPALQMYLRIAEGDFGYASAIGVVLFVMIMLLTLFILRFRRNDAIETA